MTDNTWGGARPGSGRKSVAPTEKRIQMTITILRETKEKILKVAKFKGIKPGKLIDQIFDNF